MSLTPELWQRVCQAYDRAAELGAEERAEFLGTLRQTDADAAVALEDLLNRRAGVDAFPGPPTDPLDGLLDTEAGGTVVRSGNEEWPERIHGYRVTRELARGGMGVVLLAVDEKFNRPIAVKILAGEHANNKDLVMRFLEEAHLMGRLQHPGIPPVHDCGELPDSRPYLAMKLIKGQTLSEMLRSRPTPPNGRDLSRWLSIFEQICHTLAYTHVRGILHRDLKPGNIMVGAHGEVQVMDWGLAKVLSRRGDAADDTRQKQREAASFFMAPSDSGPTTSVGSVMGTIAYMAPEQARGEIEFLDERCDVFGLGAILCEVLTGKPPFQADRTGDLIDLARAGDLSHAFARLDGCGADAKLIELAKACLAPQRSGRPRDAGAVAQVIVEYGAEFQQRLRTAEIDQAAAQVKVAEERKRRVAGRRWAALVMALIAIASAVGAWLYIESQEAKLQARQGLLKAKVEDTLREEEAQSADLHLRLADYRRAQQLISDPSDWNSQLSRRRELLERAENLLAGSAGPGAADLARKATDAGIRLVTDEQDLAFAKELDAIHLEFFVPFIQEKLKRAAVSPKYARFFAERLQMDFAKADTKAIAAKIQQSRLRQVLVSALDHWAEVATDDKAPHLLPAILQVATAVDPDPWRDRLRSKERWTNLPHLQKLVTDLKPAEQSPQIHILLASLLEEKGGDGCAVLQGALLEHPRNFWLNLTVPNYTRRWEEKAGYFQAALAARQDNAAVWTNLGANLVARRKFVEAMNAYGRAIQLNPKDWSPHRGIARLHLDEGYFDKAKRAIEQASKLLGPDHPFHEVVRSDEKECNYCLKLQEAEKLQPLEPAAPQKTILGRLSPDDPADLYLGNVQSPRKAHAVQFLGGKNYQVDLESPDFDPILRVEDVDWLPIVSNDDIIRGKLLSSRIVFAPADGAVFRLVVNAFNPKRGGAYRLRWRQVATDGPPKKIEGELKRSTPKIDEKHAEEHKITLAADTPYVIRLSAGRFDTYLRLLDTAGNLLAFNDDVANGDRNSRIDFTPAQSGQYVLRVTSYMPGETGSYVLTVQGFKPAAP